MHEIVTILDKLAAAAGRNEKKAILASLVGTPIEEEFKAYCYLALDPHNVYYVVDYPQADRSTNTLFGAAETIGLPDALGQLHKLTSRQLTGHAAIDFLKGLDASLDERDADALRRVIKGDLKCGVAAKTINEVWKNLIYIHPYNRCTSFSMKAISAINYPAYSQEKVDGMYVDVIVDGNFVTCMSRYGKIVNRFPESIKLLLSGNAAPVVFMGELVVYKNGEVLPREVGNGFINSDDVDPEAEIHLRLWDMVPLADWQARKTQYHYEERFIYLSEFLNDRNCAQLELVKTRCVLNPAEAIDHFSEIALAGGEGTVLKDYAMLWSDGTSTKQVKLKVEFECELKVVEIKPGENKYTGQIGSLICETSDGKLRVGVSGLTDAQRKLGDQYIGKIITAKSNMPITDESGKHSLFLPRIVEVRHDKNEADSLERVYEQYDSAIALLKSTWGSK